MTTTGPSLIRSWVYLVFRFAWREQERLFGEGQLSAWLLEKDCQAQDKWFGGRYETISGHLGKVQQRYGGKIPWRARPLQALTSRLLDFFDPGHCQKSIGV